MKTSEIPRHDAWPAEVPLHIQHLDFCWTYHKPWILGGFQLKPAEVLIAKSDIDFCGQTCFRDFWIKSVRFVIGEFSDLDKKDLQTNCWVYFVNIMYKLHWPNYMIYIFDSMFFCDQFLSNSVSVWPFVYLYVFMYLLFTYIYTWVHLDKYIYWSSMDLYIYINLYI